MEERYHKLFLALRYYLLGANYHMALRAFDFARKIHSGVRKDGVTAEFSHQVEIALYLTTLRHSLMDEHRTLAAALLHDTMEDYANVTSTDIRNITDERVEQACVLLNKNGRNMDNYFGDIGNNAIASIVKISDRIHNVNSMKGVFSPEKQQAYLQEANKYLLPMSKNARTRFPEQMAAYFNAEFVLRSQINLLKSE